MKMQKSVKNVKKKIQNKHFKDREYCKVRDHCHYAGENSWAVHSICNWPVHSICNIKYSVLEKIPMTFYNRCNYGYHFIIK